MRMLLRDTVLRTLLCEDVAAYFLHLDRDNGAADAILCEDVAARFAAADAAGVRMLLRV